MRKRRTAGAIAGVAVGLVAAALAVLGAPTALWIVVLILGGLMLVYAGFLYFFGSEEPEPRTGDDIDIETGDVSQSTIIGKVDRERNG